MFRGNIPNANLGKYYHERGFDFAEIKILFFC